jgi:phosphohistidine phosphatase
VTSSTGRLVVLIRHAKAESGEGGADHDRELTSQGRDVAAAAGRWLATHVPTPERVWCSSAIRAQQTWSAVAESVSAGEVEVDRGLYQAGPREVVERVRATEAPTLVVVGHNPTLEQVLADLSGEQVGLRAGAVAVVDLDTGRLVDRWDPPR